MATRHFASFCEYAIAAWAGLVDGSVSRCIGLSASPTNLEYICAAFWPLKHIRSM
jgi:hypothetical protein